ncbi:MULTISPECIES: tyrosine--tRNA ligase [unclassified Lentimonas]|uniref:tyrosine--tRNA ligase n=1 Tax=unclassified Lentimonas TaxID=2630993 RepID=UPI00132715ED|nr:MULTISPECIES: tyrosine--tRNA ligase [unclassified Lentimonas]CAA6676687.1 Tyrosyl-tRNA synthetase (EC [Lentimonas sp. CC4]CAA6684649.1 Tyrosyl-tRNA synthetase (EC [Lentimonas sp. CC6]CAA7075284.1 Tyrosyl-tRNA synthetase (EC [Lentimonas sp. CC4]CAA7170670.1 Tyrosyl-tRNA synthetase (EC [Lentimonas sp. CC21]CAA7182307.1 Tyrosyl-tRNA synthetase (EC [Lentimonas sp. CC8]
MSLIETIRTNTDTVIGDTELEDRLHGNRPLRVKLGVDPTRPDLTFGHLVVFNKLRQFQDLGHEAVLIIGDFTTLIGDPSGRSDTRPVLTKDEIMSNADTYLEQAFKILDEDKTTVVYNSEWFDKMGFEDCLKLARKMTVARMLERDDFAKRYKGNAPISIIEFLYPLIQGYDSLVLNADVEIGGTDQLFNMLVGRALQKDAGKQEQAVITMPLLVGLDGSKKMSKSADNYIAFTDSPKEMFGKIMSISDETMWTYYQLLLESSEDKIEKLKAGHPMLAKKHLASALVGQFHSMDAGKHELEQFEKVFSKNKLPDDMPTFTWSDMLGDAESAPLFEVMAQSELFESKGAIRRLVQQGGVKIDTVKQEDPNKEITRPDNEMIFQAGKRVFFKLLA